MSAAHAAEDARLLALLGMLWWWADHVYRPSPLWRRLGLWRPEVYGEPPPPDPTPGGGPLLSLRPPEPAPDEAPTDPSVAAFDRIADVYADAVAPFSRPIFEEAMKRVAPRLDPAARVLDPSCGPGWEAAALARYVPRGEVVAADLAPGMVRRAGAWASAQRATNMAFVVSDVAAPAPQLHGTFDAVFSMLAFHHYPDAPGAAAGLRRVLRAGGQAFIVDLGTAWARDLSRPAATLLDPGFVRHHTGPELRAMFEGAGFASVYWEEILPGMGLTIAVA